ncbi:MAG: zinc ribbon domain-containing protein [Chloroflexia bacterium]
MREVERLYRLQELDEGLALCERKIQEWAAQRKRLQEGLERIRQTRQESARMLRSQELRLHQAESALWEQENRLKELEGLLYSDAVRSERELQALQSEIEQIRRQKDALESDALQIMLDLDAHRARLEELAAEEERCAQGYETFAQETARQEACLREEMEPLRADRERVASEVSPYALVLYEQLRRTRGGPAVVPVVNNTCGGCHLEVPLLTRKAALGEALVRCEHCGRILFLS